MKIKEITKGGRIPTADFEVKGTHCYYMGNGVLSHNTSTSIFMDAGAGMMPVYAPFFIEANKGQMPVSSMYLEENPLGYARTFGQHDQIQLTKVIGATQKFVDTGISAEYLLDHNKPGFSAKDLYDVLMSAWREKTKATYYIRHIKRGKTVEDLLGIKEAGCAGCAG